MRAESWLQVGDSGSQLQADDASASSSCRGDLVRLPRGHYDVVLMSLVLSYLPHPLLRTRMVLKVRAVPWQTCPAPQFPMYLGDKDSLGPKPRLYPGRK